MPSTHNLPVRRITTGMICLYSKIKRNEMLKRIHALPLDFLSSFLSAEVPAEPSAVLRRVAPWSPSGWSNRFGTAPSAGDKRTRVSDFAVFSKRVEPSCIFAPSSGSCLTPSCPLARKSSPARWRQALLPPRNSLKNRFPKAVTHRRAGWVRSSVSRRTRRLSASCSDE